VLLIPFHRWRPSKRHLKKAPTIGERDAR
jgi:hypothetical protein